MKQTNTKLVALAVFVAAFMSAIEGTIVTTAMPTIIADLKGLEIMNWAFSIYLFMQAIFTPVYGKLSDTFGRKKLFIIGVVIFMIGSFGSGMSYNMQTLIVMRAIQGAGSAALGALSMTIIADIYEDLGVRARMLGLMSAAWGVASIVGPLAGGIIVDQLNWHWIFYINVPIGVIVLFLLANYLHEPQHDTKGIKVDVLGSSLLAFALIALMLAVQFFGDKGLSIWTILLLALSVVLFVIFGQVEKKASDPVIPLPLFKNRQFILINVIAFLLSGALIAIDVYVPMWLQGIGGYNPTVSGVVLAPMSLLWIVGSQIVGRNLKRFGIRKLLIGGSFVVIMGMLVISFIPQTATWLPFAIVATLLGIGFGVTFTIFTVETQQSVDKKDIGVATSFNMLIRSLGPTIMISIYGAILNGYNFSHLPKGTTKEMMNLLINAKSALEIPKQFLTPLRDVLHSGIQLVDWVILGMAVLATALGFLMKDKD
jgi:EmrB/QacA subfamily drug resistance transporter